ncbi:MAG: polysaccharide biosynthesis/export family protein [Phycisphaerales bacterium]|nr:MAG: polysaccharide biosynthesis/export family protein [Phycisphaerales bacterium]
MGHSRTVLVVLLSLIAVGMAGCFASKPGDIEAFLKPEKADVTGKDYVLQPPDQIEVYSLRVPEINLQRQQIRPDGKVSFQALGEVEAAGKTLSQLTKDLEARAAKRYKLADENPIDIHVVRFESKWYYVLGQVHLEGPKLWTGRDSVLSALAEARLNPMAWKQQIQVIRPSPQESVRPRIFQLDLERMMVYGDTSKNVLLRAGDIVYVPPTPLASVGLLIEEFTRPIGRAFSTVTIVQRASVGGGGGYGGTGGF